MSFLSEIHKRSRPWARAVVWILLAGLSSGCAGYRLGPVNGVAAGDKTVQINPFPNRTLQPRLTDAVTAQLRKELQRDGTYRLASHDDGDIIVSGEILRYDRTEVTLSPSDILVVQDFKLTLTAKVTAVQRGSDKPFLDQTVSGYTLVRVTSDLTSAELQALPLLAQDLARNVTALLAEGKW